MPDDYTKDIFTEELDRLHDIQLLLQEQFKFFAGKAALEALPLRDMIKENVPTL